MRKSGPSLSLALFFPAAAAAAVRLRLRLRTKWRNHTRHTDVINSGGGGILVEDGMEALTLPCAY